MQDFFVHFKLRVFVYVTTITFYAELNAYLDVSLSAKLCLNLPGSLIGPSINALATISLTPNVRVSPEGGVYISVLVIAVTFVIKYIIFSLQVERVQCSTRRRLKTHFWIICSFSLNCMILCTYACTIMKVYPLGVDYIIWLRVTWLSRDKRWQ